MCVIDSSVIVFLRYSFLSVLVFFFKQKTAYEFRISDWTSDVCSSDLAQGEIVELKAQRRGDIAIRRLFVRQHDGEADRFAPLVGGAAVRGLHDRRPAAQIGRASGRESVCQYV